MSAKPYIYQLKHIYKVNLNNIITQICLITFLLSFKFWCDFSDIKYLQLDFHTTETSKVCI